MSKEITNEQILAGSAVKGDNGKPVGRNTAIDVYDAMCNSSPAIPNKAEVGCERDDGLLNIHPEHEFCEVCTPPATTGASTAQGEELAEEILTLHRQLAAEKLRANQGWERAEAKSRECLQLRERMALGASTVLTDERIDQLARTANLDGSMLVGKRSDYWRSFARAIAREVAAQAGQVAVPEGWKLVPLEPTDAMMDAPEVKVGGCYSCSPEQVGWHDCAEIYRLMVAAAPSPAKESK
jgi:hypothetical protein